MRRSGVSLTKNSLLRLKRSVHFLHYPNKWKTSRSAAMSHSLGSQPGNSRLGPSKVPETTGKRLRRFVCTLLFRNFEVSRRFDLSIRSLFLPSARRPLHSAIGTSSQQPRGSETG